MQVYSLAKEGGMEGRLHVRVQLDNACLAQRDEELETDSKGLVRFCHMTKDCQHDWLKLQTIRELFNEVMMCT